jgi:hypothetical protein
MSIIELSTACAAIAKLNRSAKWWRCPIHLSAAQFVRCQFASLAELEANRLLRPSTLDGAGQT